MRRCDSQVPLALGTDWDRVALLRSFSLCLSLSTWRLAPQIRKDFDCINHTLETNLVAIMTLSQASKLKFGQRSKSMSGAEVRQESDNDHCFLWWFNVPSVQQLFSNCNQDRGNKIMIYDRLDYVFSEEYALAWGFKMENTFTHSQLGGKHTFCY